MTPMEKYMRNEMIIGAIVWGIAGPVVTILAVLAIFGGAN